MAKSQDDITKDMFRAFESVSPHLRLDPVKGPFFNLSTRAVAVPLSEESANVERLAQISTLQFPNVVTDTEMQGTATSFSIGLGQGGFSQGTALFYTSRRPGTGQSFIVREGDIVATSSINGVTFAATETRSLTGANADTYFNPANRRFELPVSVAALVAGVDGDVPPLSLARIVNGAQDFDGVSNNTRFRGGGLAETKQSAYARCQQKLAGIERLSVGGLESFAQNVDVDRIQAIALVPSTEYPTLFQRLPDGPAVDVFSLSTAVSQQFTDSFVAAAGQTVFYPSLRPVLSLTEVLVNGVTVSTASLTLDETLSVGRSTRENSYVTLPAPASLGDVVDITYDYDSLLTSMQSAIDGYKTENSGALFSTDVLVRYPHEIPLACQITGTVLGTFDPTSIEQEIAVVVADFLVNGTDDAPKIGGMRAPADLRNLILTRVPGIATMSIDVFGRKAYGSIVEVIDIPRHSVPVIEDADDVFIKFT